jgi:ADP-heptose:LPS heptosyltransferase
MVVVTPTPAISTCTDAPSEIERLIDLERPRVAVFRALQLGDLLCAVPALRTLRAALPHAHMTLIGLPWAESFARRFPAYIDEFIAFPGHPALRERAPAPGELPTFLARIEAAALDFAVQLHGSGGVTNSIVASLGARRCAGFAVPGAWRPVGTFPDWPAIESEVWRWLRLVHAIGGGEGDEALEWPVADADRDGWRALATALGVDGDYAVIHAGASVPERCWPPERFAAVARWLHGRGITVVVTGTEPERERAESVARIAGVPVVDVVGRTDLGVLGALLDGARLLVCNDTGLSHMAAALRVPSVVCSGPPDVNGWAPLDRQLHRVLYRPWGVPVESAIAAARELLEREGHAR